MSERLDISEVTSFVTVLIDADSTGASIGAVLKQQSTQMRLERFTRAERSVKDFTNHYDSYDDFYFTGNFYYGVWPSDYSVCIGRPIMLLKNLSKNVVITNQVEKATTLWKRLSGLIP